MENTVAIMSDSRLASMAEDNKIMRRFGTFKHAPECSCTCDECKKHLQVKGHVNHGLFKQPILYMHCNNKESHCRWFCRY